jgi:plasmid stabilization system protein ParE
VKFQVRYTKDAREDICRLYSFLLDLDPSLARRARDAIAKNIAKLEDFPTSCRRISKYPPFLHELIIPFGSAGYIALFEVEDNGTVTILAIRHQREAGYL